MGAIFGDIIEEEEIMFVVQFVSHGCFHPLLYRFMRENNVSFSLTQYEMFEVIFSILFRHFSTFSIFFLSNSP